MKRGVGLILLLLLVVNVIGFGSAIHTTEVFWISGNDDVICSEDVSTSITLDSFSSSLGDCSFSKVANKGCSVYAREEDKLWGGKDDCARGYAKINSVFDGTNLGANNYKKFNLDSVDEDNDATCLLEEWAWGFENGRSSYLCNEDFKWYVCDGSSLGEKIVSDKKVFECGVESPFYKWKIVNKCGEAHQENFETQAKLKAGGLCASDGTATTIQTLMNQFLWRCQGTDSSTGKAFDYHCRASQPGGDIYWVDEKDKQIKEIEVNNIVKMVWHDVWEGTSQVDVNMYRIQPFEYSYSQPLETFGTSVENNQAVVEWKIESSELSGGDELVFEITSPINDLGVSYLRILEKTVDVCAAYGGSCAPSSCSDESGEITKGNIACTDSGFSRCCCPLDGKWDGSKCVGMSGAECGTADGQTFSETPTTNLCNTGTASTVTLSENKYSWTCTGYFDYDGDGKLQEVVDNCKATYNSTGGGGGGTGVCGNNVAGEYYGEKCDGTDLDGKTCITQGFDSGDLACYPAEHANECQFDTSGCVDDSGNGVNKVCSDGNVDQPNTAGFNEQCDGSNLGIFTSEDCEEFDEYKSGGVLSCFSDCTFDFRACEKPQGQTEECGDGVVNTVNEDCDTLDLQGETCKSQGYDYGILKCYEASHANECTLNKTGCYSGTPPGPTPSTPGLYWINGTNNEITESKVDKAVKLFWKDSGLSQGTAVEFEIYDDDIGGDDLIRSVNVEIDSDGEAIAQITITQDNWAQGDGLFEGGHQEWYFIVSVPTGHEALKSGELKVAAKYIPENGECGDADGGEFKTKSELLDEGACENYEIDEDEIAQDGDDYWAWMCDGKDSDASCTAEIDKSVEAYCGDGVCNDDETVDDCEIDCITYTQDGNCAWIPVQDGSCSEGDSHFNINYEYSEENSNNSEAECGTKDSMAIFCPVKLGYFTTTNIIIAIVLIIIIYIIIAKGCCKKKKGGKRKKKKK